MRQVLKISEAASIAMHALILLAEKGDEPVSNILIAKEFNISANHSSKVMQRLLKSGFVRAVRGPGGGYSLASLPGKITLLDIYRAVDGEPDNSGCLFGKGKHCSLKKCLFSELICEAETLVEKQLGSVTLADYVSNGIDIEGKNNR
jgi:Rrf2 family protein